MNARDSLKFVRDELRLRAHLAGMDAHDAWARARRPLRKLPHRLTDLSDFAEGAATMIIGGFEMLKARVMNRRRHS